MFPNNKSHTSGIFVKEQVVALKNFADLDITVISPIPYSPKILWFNKRWRHYGEVYPSQKINGTVVHFPRYICFPGKRIAFLNGITMAITLFISLKKMVTKENTIIHSHSIFPVGFAIGLIKKFYNKFKSVCTIHGSDINIFPFKTKLNYKSVKFALKQHDLIITVSDALKEKVTNINPGVKISTITNGVNYEKFTKKPEFETEIYIKNIIQHNDNYKYVLFVGHLIKEKGIFELLEAFSIIAGSNHDVRLVYVGSGIDGQDLNYMCNSFNLNDKVFLFGQVSHEEVSCLMHICDYFVLPSYSEGMPTVMFEAMACGLPIVISDVGGVKEIIRDSENGIVIKSQSISDIVNAFESLLRNRALCEKLAYNAHHDVLNYTWKKNAEKNIEIYTQVLSDTLRSFTN